MTGIRIRNTVLLIALALSIAACDVLRQAGEMYNLTRCKFRLYTVENIHVAGVYVQNKDSWSDLNISDATKLLNAVARKDMPLEFTLNIQARNPNNQTASLNDLDWILYIDDIEMTSGSMDQRVSIPANGGVQNLPLNINVELFNALSGKSAEAIKNFAFNLAGQGDRPTRITVRAKPTVYVSGQALDYPGYITIENEYTSGGSTSGGSSKNSGTIKL